MWGWGGEGGDPYSRRRDTMYKGAEMPKDNACLGKVL